MSKEGSGCIMITKQQKEHCKSLLQQRQTELIHLVQSHFDLKNEFAKESLGELSNYDNHPGDHGTELFERGKDIALNEHAEKELEEINEALHALEEGTYGICSECGVDIPYERLQAVPATDRCIEHAKKDTFKHQRPVEEQVFSPSINPDDGDEDQVGYDAEDTWQDVARPGTSETPSDFYGDRDNYDEMYPNSDERVGSVDELEDFLAADANGKYIGAAYRHKKYEARIDDDEQTDDDDI